MAYMKDSTGRRLDSIDVPARGEVAPRIRRYRFQPIFINNLNVYLREGSTGMRDGYAVIDGDQITLWAIIKFGGTGIVRGSGGSVIAVRAPVPWVNDNLAIYTVNGIGWATNSDATVKAELRITPGSMWNGVRNPVLTISRASDGVAVGVDSSSAVWANAQQVVFGPVTYQIDPEWLTSGALSAGGFITDPVGPTWYTSLYPSADTYAQHAVKIDPDTPAGVQPLGQSSGWNVALSEEFNGAPVVQDDVSGAVYFRPDGALWKSWYRTINSTGHTSNTNRERQWYDPRGISTSAGKLILTATKDGRHSAAYNGTVTLDYSSGMITSWGMHEQMYGYWEARIKCPLVVGAWPAFWMCAAQPDWPPEIDILENFGTYSSGICNTFPNSGGATTTRSWGVSAGDWHVYGMEWTSGYVKFYLDGTLVATESSSGNIPAQTMQTILNLAVDGNQAIDDAHFPISMEIDYVRVWTPA